MSPWVKFIIMYTYSAIMSSNFASNPAVPPFLKNKIPPPQKNIPQLSPRIHALQPSQSFDQSHKPKILFQNFYIYFKSKTAVEGGLGLALGLELGMSPGATKSVEKYFCLNLCQITRIIMAEKRQKVYIIIIFTHGTCGVLDCFHGKNFNRKILWENSKNLEFDDLRTQCHQWYLWRFTCVYKSLWHNNLYLTWKCCVNQCSGVKRQERLSFCFFEKQFDKKLLSCFLKLLAGTRNSSCFCQWSWVEGIFWFFGRKWLDDKFKKYSWKVSKKRVR